MPSEGSAKQADLDAFERFCSHLILEDGSAFVLQPFQRRMLSDYFAGVRESLILIPKKNGKTTLLAALALWHLLTTPNAACFIAAASRDQATILYDQARGFVQRSAGLDEHMSVKKGYREIRSKRDEGIIRVLAADADTADGVLPTLALVDELHRQKSSDLYGIFRDGLGARGGRMLTISTAGDNEDSPLGKLRKAAHSLPGFSQDGAYRHVSAPGFALHEWALDAEEDREDMEVVKRANPAPWQTVEELRTRFESPSMTPWQWARFAGGVWLAGEDGAISAKEWRACADPASVIPGGAEGVHVGIDLGWRWDTTAIVPVRREGRTLTVHCPTILVPPRDGTSLNAEVIWSEVAMMAERWPGLTVVIDPEAGGEQLAQRIERELDVEVVAHSQKPSPMALAAQRLSEAIVAGDLRHPDDEALTRHVLSAAPQSVGEGWRLVKSAKTKLPIDGAIALAMAASIATRPPQEKASSKVPVPIF